MPSDSCHKNALIKLTIVIPCFNELDNLQQNVLSKVRAYLLQQDYTWEVIISDDGSTDGSSTLVASQIANWDGFRVIRNQHRGKPSALSAGLVAANGELVLFTDMDQATPITELDKLMDQMGPGVGVVIGSRGLFRKNFPWYRKLGSIAFMSIRKAFILPRINDTQCGFKLLKTSTAREAFGKLQIMRNSKEISGWRVTAFDVELLHVLEKMGCTIKEVGVVWEDSGIGKKKRGVLLRYLRESGEMLEQIIRVKLNDLRGVYKS